MFIVLWKTNTNFYLNKYYHNITQRLNFIWDVIKMFDMKRKNVKSLLANNKFDYTFLILFFFISISILGNYNVFLINCCI